jgi:tripartite-type tricarboxylate transporter receptor subunit TctC
MKQLKTPLFTLKIQEEPSFWIQAKASICALIFAIVLANCLTNTAKAQTDYPNRPIRFVVSFAPGSSTDIVTRLLAQKLTERMGQPIVIDIKAGAGGLIGNDFVAKSAPDGYNMVLLTGGHPSSVAMIKKLPYDPIKDFGMVSTIVTYPMVVSVAKDSALKSLPDLIALAKSHPNQVSFSSSGVGSLHHLLGEWINIEAGIDMLHIPFKGSSQSITELLGGRVDVMVDTATFTFGQIKGGKLRALAVSSESRSPFFPDVPTVKETLPAIEFSSWLGVVVAPGTPRPIVDKLNKELRAIVGTEEIKQKFAEFGGIPLASSPEEMRDRIEKEIDRWKRVVEIKHIEKQ